jgi:hypothetical protein
MFSITRRLRGGAPTDGTARSTGQTLVEFALVLPLFMAVLMGVIEGGIAMAANIGINRAAQSGAHMASMAGNIIGADCLVLDQIENSVMPPNDRARIQSVRVELTDLSGNDIRAYNTWSRTGRTICTVADDLTLDLPYTKASGGYPDTQRCNVLNGCPTMTPTRSTVDSIAVVVRYHHDWITPLGSIFPFPGGDDGTGWTFEQRNVFRMEPHR